MCGIVGKVNFHGNIDGSDGISDAIKIMTHRGPNEQKRVMGEYWDVGFCRLSILDLNSTGSQPMYSRDQNSIIVFNGEIYNFIELKSKLIKNGIQFKSSGDTEVLLYWLKLYGADGLKDLNGMFSIAYLDINKKKLLLARDRIGKKPLLYSKKGGEIFFSSEIKALLKIGVGKEINQLAVKQYFCYNYIPGKNTIYKNIFKLDPGHFVEFNVNNLSNFKSKRFWNIAYEPNKIKSTNEWCDNIDFLINDSVKLRMQSDVKVGTFLSGGIDSSLITAVANMNSGINEIIAFTVGFSEKNWDESLVAKSLAEKYKLNHEVIFLEPGLEETLSQLVWHYEEPFSDSSSIPTYYLCKAASKFGTVFLSGDGGDEIFAGYKRYMTVDDNNLIDLIPRSLRIALQKLVDSCLPRFSNVRSKLIRSSLSKVDRQIYNYFPHPKDPLNYQLLNSDYRTEFFDEQIESYNEMKNLNDLPIISKMQLLDLKYYLPYDILNKVDRASMAHSIEVRCPLLDHRLVDLAFQIPVEKHIDSKLGKNLLKKVASKYLPISLLNHKKQGFGFPLHSFFKNNKDVIYDYLRSDTTQSRPIYNKKSLNLLWSFYEKDKKNISESIWKLMFFEEWNRQFVDNNI